jgi:hypothetical protein
MIADGMNGALTGLIGGLLLSVFTSAMVIIRPAEYRLITIVVISIINYAIISSETRSLMSSTIGYLFGYGIVVYFIASVDVKLALQMFAPYFISIAILIYNRWSA